MSEENTQNNINKKIEVTAAIICHLIQEGANLDRTITRTDKDKIFVFQGGILHRIYGPTNEDDRWKRRVR